MNLESLRKKAKKVKPRQGLKVREPDSFKHLPAKGKTVIMNTYWLRRLKDGDIELVETEKPAKNDKNK